MAQEQKLIDSIINQAEKDSISTIAKAEEEAALKFKSLDRRIEDLKKETDSRIAEKLQEIKVRTDSAVKTEKRRQKLKNLDSLNSEIKKIFFSKIKNLIGTDEYNRFLSKLIAEGAVAVGGKRVFVNHSILENIDEKIINEASELTKKLTGKKIEILISDKERLPAQGIIVESEDGRIAYNNLIETRLRRFEEDVKGVISKWIPE